MASSTVRTQLPLQGLQLFQCGCVLPQSDFSSALSGASSAAPSCPCLHFLSCMNPHVSAEPDLHLGRLQCTLHHVFTTFLHCLLLMTMVQWLVGCTGHIPKHTQGGCADDKRTQLGLQESRPPPTHVRECRWEEHWAGHRSRAGRWARGWGAWPGGRGQVSRFEQLLLV